MKTNKRKLEQTTYIYIIYMIEDIQPTEDNEKNLKRVVAGGRTDLQKRLPQKRG